MVTISHSSVVVPEFKKKQAEVALESFLNRSEIGFKDLTHRISYWEQCYQLGREMAQKYQQLVVVGVGGSSLGTLVIAEVFAIKNILFVDNVDAIAFEALFESVEDLNKTGWLFISKSGTTIETLCALEFIDQLYRGEGLSLAKQATIISEKKESSLTKWAAQNQVPHAEIPEDVGGRFSVLTPVGMLPAAYAGLDIEKFRIGAAKALANPALVQEVMGQAMISFERQEWVTLLWSYSSRMKSFGGWFQQLWAESLAKKVTRENLPAPRCSTPMAAVGACDQHSILQQVMEGARDKFVVFQRFEDAESGSSVLTQSQFSETKTLVGRSMGQLLQAEAIATQEALNEVGVMSLTLQTKVLDEESLGFLFMFWQLVVAGLGEVLNVDAFDQPGVELGKRLAKEKLSKASLS